MESVFSSRVFTSLYKGKEEEAKARYRRVSAGLAALTEAKDVSFFSVPGRTEVMGNHTDHNHGQVLAASVNLDIVAAAVPTDNTTVTVKSEGFGIDTVDISDLSVHPEEKNTSAAIIRGVAAAFLARGRKVGGFTCCMTSDVPGGSGLSSSAAFENMIGTVFNYFYNGGAVDYIELAQSSQSAENKYFGKPCGLMDQIACAAGGFVTIDFADPKKPVAKKLAFDIEAEGYTLCIVKTGGSHADLTEDYASIPAEMKAVAAEFGKETLRGLDEKTIYGALPSLRASVGDRAVLRSLHFLAENERVGKAVKALDAGDTDAFLSLVRASGRSSAVLLQNYFSCKNPGEQGITLAVSLADSVIAPRGAARVHGGGFAGTAQAFVPTEKLGAFTSVMESAFGKGCVSVLSVRPVGACPVK